MWVSNKDLVCGLFYSYISVPGFGLIQKGLHYTLLWELTSKSPVQANVIVYVCGGMRITLLYIPLCKSVFHLWSPWSAWEPIERHLCHNNRK